MLRIEMLPAAHGDCLWIEYGSQDAPRRILIDTGTPGTYKKLTKKIADLPKDQRRFELFIVSHIDGDHIGDVTEAVFGIRPGALGVVA